MSTDAPMPSGHDLNALLGAGIQRLSTMAPALEAPDEALVPIASLLYRGDAALARAITLVDQLAARGSAPDRERLDERLDEIRDLLRLATSE